MASTTTLLATRQHYKTATWPPQHYLQPDNIIKLLHGLHNIICNQTTSYNCYMASTTTLLATRQHHITATWPPQQHYLQPDIIKLLHGLHNNITCNQTTSYNCYMASTTTLLATRQHHITATWPPQHYLQPDNII